jgi:type 1 glutamine amidotransferase
MRSVLALVANMAACHASTSHDVADGEPMVDARAPAAIDAHCDGIAGKPRVLVFSAENLWNHPSTPIAAQTFLTMCQTRGYSVTASRDPAAFLEQLPATDVVVFAVTSGPVLTDEARAVLEPWVRAGGGVMGIHSASATELQWPFFIDLMGGQFSGHGPGLYRARLVVDDGAHPTTAGIHASSMTRSDEWYSFVKHPEALGMTVLMSLDESTLPADYLPELLMGYHANTWVHQLLGGRVFYTALGHVPETYSEPWFVDMLGRAVEWTALGKAIP